MQIKHSLVLLVFMAKLHSFSADVESTNSDLKLWYQEPAEEWTEALPVGNGRLGAMVFGEVFKERIQLNEESVWAGKKIKNNNPAALKHLQEIQQLLLSGNNAKARKLAEEYLLGTPPRIRSYQTLGDLRLDFSFDEDSVQDYRRELDLSSGISSVIFNVGNTEYSREVFASAPDNVLVVRISSSQKLKIGMRISLERIQDATTEVIADNVLQLRGQIKDLPDPRRGPGGNHMRFGARLLVLNEGGGINSDQNQMVVSDANAVTLILTAVTDYDLRTLSFDRSVDPSRVCQEIIEEAARKPYSELKNRHVTDHKALFDRVEIDLGQSPHLDVPTDKRLERVRQGATDLGLISLYFQYGRYLLMGSSRFPGVLPANLQGVWNDRFDPPWNSDFHTNINLQMNYWPAEVCNLPETVLPLTNFFTELLKPGSMTAKEMYGARGWTMHHVTDPFGRTGLMDGIQWGTSPLAGAWMTLTFWRHFEFTQDRCYLKEKAYPIMRGAAQFVLDFLIEDEEGRLVTAPSMSPENAFRLPGDEGEHQLTYASTIDIQIITELFNACIRASEILESDVDFAVRMKEALLRLPPVQIGKDGTIQEWIEDYEEAEPGHRHMSHLFGLHPGSQITPETPELFSAAKKTIERRLAHGGGYTGWSRAWIINFYARLLDANNAYQSVLALLRDSTLANLFDSHPPFQIDGNFGGTAGISEMLLQSHNNEIHILPALPTAWERGYVRGLRARGNVEVDIYWLGNRLDRLEVRTFSDGECKIRYKNRVSALEAVAGNIYRLDSDLKLVDE